MNNQILQVKVKERINKKDSSDFPNLEPYQTIEAFNKAMDAWVRRMIEGINQTKTGAEGSTRRIDDLQVLLTDWSVTWTSQDIYWESPSLPTDYMEWCVLTVSGQDECKECPPRQLVSYLGTEADKTIDIRDNSRKPSYAWAETFHTTRGNKIRIYTNGEFNIVNPVVTYYKAPTHIEIAGAVNPDTGTVSTIDVLCELPDGVIELIIDDAAAILSGDWDAYQKTQYLNASTEHNN